MCSALFGGSPAPPPPPPIVAPPPPPPPIVIAPPPAAQMIPKKKEQLRPGSPVKRARGGVRRRGKAMLKIPLNTSGSGINI